MTFTLSCFLLILVLFVYFCLPEVILSPLFPRYFVAQFFLYKSSSMFSAVILSSLFESINPLQAFVFLFVSLS